ncbi:MAG: hypothetical protein ACM3H7_02460, partial [Acidobacteriaceae bacterium]
GAYQAVAVPDKPCPSCGQLVKANAQRCPYCGGSLVTAAAQPAPTPITAPKKTSIWLIAGGVVLSLLCIGALIAYIVASNKTNEVTATVSGRTWQMSIDIIEKLPVQRSSWEDEIPAGAQEISCRDEYRETSDLPAPKSTEVCGTPYTVDTGSGAGKVVQDCVYRLYASYCNYSVLDWSVVDTLVANGSDGNPEWPSTALQAGQQAGDYHESYQVSFAADGQTYAYTPADSSEFSQYDPGSEWILAINTFGQIKEISRK